jgi:hypothetical protein
VARSFRSDEVDNLWALEEDDFWERQRRKEQGGGDEVERRAPKAKGADGSSVDPIPLDDSDNENGSGWDSGAEERRGAERGGLKIVNKQKDSVLDYLQQELLQVQWIVRSFEHDSLLQVCDPRLPCCSVGRWDLVGFGVRRPTRLLAARE